MNQKNPSLENTLSWIARGLTILFIIFLIIFSFDAFSTSSNAGRNFLAFFIHNIPTIVLIVVLLFAWKHDFVGAIAFYLAGITYIGIISFYQPIDTVFLWSLNIALPAFIIGTLYLFSYLMKLKRKSNLT